MKMDNLENMKMITNMARRALKLAVDNCGYRHLFCFDVKYALDNNYLHGYDCACCISYEDGDTCGCICHERIRELDRVFYAVLRGMIEGKEKPPHLDGG